MSASDSDTENRTEYLKELLLSAEARLNSGPHFRAWVDYEDKYTVIRVYFDRVDRPMAGDWGLEIARRDEEGVLPLLAASRIERIAIASVLPALAKEIATRQRLFEDDTTRAIRHLKRWLVGGPGAEPDDAP